MNKIKKAYENKKELKINENNDIDSIIEIFQRFGKKYKIITTTLDPNIQYQTKNMKITQTYTKTILNENLDKMIEKLKYEGNITLIIINNTTKSENKRINKKIKKLNQLKNVKTRKIEQKDTFSTLSSILDGDSK